MKTQKGGLKILLVILGAIIIIGGLFLYLQNKNGGTFDDFVNLNSDNQTQTGSTTGEAVVKKPTDTTTKPVTPVVTKAKIDFNAILDTEYINNSYKIRFMHPVSMKIKEDTTKVESDLVVVNFKDDGSISISDSGTWPIPRMMLFEAEAINVSSYNIQKTIYKNGESRDYVTYEFEILGQKYLFTSTLNESRPEEEVTKFIESIINTLKTGSTLD